MKSLPGMACLIALATTLAGCGEQERVIVYEQGRYQGKPDGKPWDNESFAGDRTQWETTVKARNQSQNEYRRING
ncbi:MAG: hypothetical protein KBF58_01355 [Methyloversatilis sp.]|jgi:hypothetical protein|nr:hypothetical protein [Methyloversatilis sp.]MBP6194704.1 hypothetical protein [Methyloversatilis sp.]MBP9116704.1 hypothetical protein [Methyloversatilis sp.]